MLRYSKLTEFYGLKFVEGWNLIGYVDVERGNDLVYRNSSTGFVFSFSGSVVSWESRKQKTVALSNVEPEYMVISKTSQEAIY